MANFKDQSFYQRLTHLFKAGPSIRRKIKGSDPKSYFDKSIIQNNLGYYGASAFKREASPFSIMGAYGLLDRMSRYAEFSEMVYMPEINSALDVYSDQSVANDENGRVLHILSDNPDVKKALEELFFEVANVEIDIRRWIRTMPVKYNSLIPLLDGRIITIEELSKELKTNKDIWTYSIKTDTHEIVPGKIIWCDKNYTTNKIVKVWLDNDSFIETAPEHPFILRNGCSKRADELKENDSLMPFYTKLSNNIAGCEKVYNPKTNKYVFTHKIIKKHCVLKNSNTKEKTKVTDHKDFSPSLKIKKKNHKIKKIEILNEICDVYCMTVVGPNGQEDRHNFPIIGRREDGNVEKNGVFVKNCQYGDFFLYIEVIPNAGVVAVEPIPVNVIEREEAFDPEDPYAVRFKLLTHGGKILENWQVVHFRIQGNELFHPYGSSILEPVRRTWRQLTMLEDAMLVYRVVRSPERRVFYIDCSGIHPNDIPTYMEAVKESMRGKDVIDRMTGRMDLRYNAIDVNEDYFLPARPNSQTKIDTLAGGQHVSATEDVEYIQKKLISGLKVPRAYLTYDEDLSSKAGLTQLDIRFSATISFFQKIIIAELSKLAIIHLYAKGFEGEDLLDFELKLSNPSTIAVQQKLQLLSSRLDAAAKAQEMANESTMFSEEWIQKNIMGFRMDEIMEIRKQRIEEQTRKLELKKVALPVENGQKTITDPFDPSNYLTIGGKQINQANQNDQQQNNLNTGSEASTYYPEPGNIIQQTTTNNKVAPIKANPTPNLDKAKRRNSRKVTYSGSRALSMPDFKKMLDPNNRYTKDPYDMASIKSSILEGSKKPILGRFPSNLPRHLLSALKKFNESCIKNDQEIDIEFISENYEHNIEDSESEIIESEADLIDLSEIEKDLNQRNK